MLTKASKNQLQKYVIVGFLFSVTFFMYGSAKACGVLFDEMTTVNGFNGWTNGLIFTLPTAIAHITAPLSNFLYCRCKRRTVGTCGGLVVGICFTCMGFFATEWFHFIALSLISGFGFGLMNFTAVLCLYEEANGSFPYLMAISSLGSYAGVTVLPFVINLLLELYGLQATFYLYGALSFNTIPICLMIPECTSENSYQATRRDELSEKEDDDCDVAEKWMQEVTKNETENVFEDDTNDSVLDSEICQNVDFYTICSLVATVINNIFDSRKQKGKPLLFIFFICLYILAASLRRFSSGIWTLFLIPFVQEMGVSVHGSILAAALGGIGGIAGRILAAVSFKIPKVHPLIIIATYSALLSLAFVFFEVYPYPVVQYTSAFTSGLLMSATSAMVTGVLALLVSDSWFTSSYSAMEIGTGVCTVISGPLAGLGYDLFGSFKMAFRMNAVLSGLCAVIYLSVAAERGAIFTSNF